MSVAFLTLALDYFQNPWQYRQLTDSSRAVSRSCADLIEALGSTLSASHIEETAAILGTSPPHLETAVRFFVRQVLLQPDADYYRLLGLPADASEAQIRQHYHLLARLFHPDRATEDLARHTADMARLNEAYAALRTPAARQAYAREVAGRKKGGHSKPRSPRRAQTRTPPSFAFAPTPPPRRRHPLSRRGMRLLAGSGLVIVALISLLLLLSVPHPPALRMAPAQKLVSSPTLESARKTPPIGHSAEATGIDPPGAQPPRSPPQGVPATAAFLQEDPRPASGPVFATRPVESSPDPASLPESPRDIETTATMPESDAGSSRAASLPTLPPSPDKAIPLAAVPTATIPRERPSPEATASAAPDSPASLPSIPERETVANSPPPLDNKQAGLLVTQFVHYYEQGDLDRLTGLFAPDIQFNEGRGRSLIRSDYGAFFQHIPERRLILNNLSWRRLDADRILGTATFEARIRTRGSDSWERQMGIIEFSIRRRNERSEIFKLIHRETAVAAFSAPAKPLPVLEPEQGRRTLSRLAHYYQSGDLGSFVALFTADAEVNAGRGIAFIRSDYGSLFARTAERRLALRNLRWHPVQNGELPGSGTFSVQVRAKNAGTWDEYRGNLDFSLRQADGSYKISRLFYRYGS